MSDTDRLSLEQYRAMTAKPALANKYNARRTEAGFDSRNEEARFRELQLLERLGRISNLECQKRIILKIGAATLYHETLNGRPAKPITYTADYAYDEDGSHVLEDYKGYDTRESRLKRQLVRAMGFTLIVTRNQKAVDRAARKAIEKKRTNRLFSKANPHGKRARPSSPQGHRYR